VLTYDTQTRVINMLNRKVSWHFIPDQILANSFLYISVTYYLCQ